MGKTKTKHITKKLLYTVCFFSKKAEQDFKEWEHKMFSSIVYKHVHANGRIYVVNHWLHSNNAPYINKGYDYEIIDCWCGGYGYNHDLSLNNLLKEVNKHIKYKAIELVLFKILLYGNFDLFELNSIISTCHIIEKDNNQKFNEEIIYEKNSI